MTRSGRRGDHRNGAITPLGHSVAVLAALLAGRSGVGLVTRFDSRSLPTHCCRGQREFRPGSFAPETSVEFRTNTRLLAAGTRPWPTPGSPTSLLATEHGRLPGQRRGRAGFRQLAVIAGLCPRMALDRSGLHSEASRFHHFEREQAAQPRLTWPASSTWAVPISLA